MQRAKILNTVTALGLGCLVAVLTITMGHWPSSMTERQLGLYTIGLLLPGILGSMAVNGNVHAFHLWVAALLNFLFYFLLCWSAGAVVIRLFRILKRP